jgi:nucleoside-diphosphate-sugar epimerase
MANPKTILVTGCAGFIGSNFVRQFADKYGSIKIVGIDNLSTGRKSAIDKRVDYINGSILDDKLLDQVFKEYRPEYVFHFAALPRVSYSLEYPKLSSEVNIIGTVGLLEVSKNTAVKRFIYSSSSSVYGGAKTLPTKESDNPPNPKSPYAVQKYVGEPFCKVFSDLFGLDTVCLRYFNAFGPGQYGDSAYASVIPAWLESVLFPSSESAFIEGDGTQSRDFCYVDNIVAANILSMESKHVFKGEVINIAHGEQTTLNEVRALIEKLTRKKLSLEQRPPRLGDVKHSLADITKAKKLLGYEPQINFEGGLEKTIDWFKSIKK